MELGAREILGSLFGGRKVIGGIREYNKNKADWLPAQTRMDSSADLLSVLIINIVLT
jgi:hypothetical protein